MRHLWLGTSTDNTGLEVEIGESWSSMEPGEVVATTRKSHTYNGLKFCFEVFFRFRS